MHRPCTRTEILDSFDVMLGAPRTHPQLGDPRPTRTGPLHRLRVIGGVTTRKPLSRLTIRQHCPGSALTASAKRLPWSSTPQYGCGVAECTGHIHYLGIVDHMVNLEEVKDVLAVIGLYEDGDEDCNNALIDHETGLKSSTVDEVLEYLWKSDQIEGVMIVGGRNPSLDDVRRVLPDRERLWGDEGLYQAQR